MGDLNEPIQTANVEGVPAEGTPNQSGVVENTTPAQRPEVDVDALKAKYEGDINNLKSTLQRREAQVTKEWQERYNGLEQKLHQTAMKSMTEDERARYERQLETEEFQSLRERLAEIENEKATMASTVSAYSFFTKQGVPADLLNLSDGYDAVVSVGWQFLTKELSDLRAAKLNPQPQPQPKPDEPAPLRQAPGVVTDKGTPASGTTWAALRAKFGTDEAVYRAVEEGRIDPSIIPTH
jgi:dsDNA-specific endonuclease/ATPase MutS2